jgi:hypothetical protein
VALSPSSSRGGGASDLAAVLAVGGDPEGHAITGAVSVATTDTDATPFTITSPDEQDADLVSVLGENSVWILNINNRGETFLAAYDGTFVNPVGYLSLGSAAELSTSLTDGTVTQSVLLGDVDVRIKAHDGVQSATVARFMPEGIVLRGVHAAPPDNTLAAGELALWFEQTDGAGKLKLKGKTANGTVVTGEVALA